MKMFKSNETGDRRKSKSSSLRTVINNERSDGTEKAELMTNRQVGRRSRLTKLIHYSVAAAGRSVRLISATVAVRLSIQDGRRIQSPVRPPSVVVFRRLIHLRRPFSSRPLRQR